MSLTANQHETFPSLHRSLGFCCGSNSPQRRAKNSGGKARQNHHTQSGWNKTGQRSYCGNRRASPIGWQRASENYFAGQHGQSFQPQRGYRPKTRRAYFLPWRLVSILQFASGAVEQNRSAAETTGLRYSGDKSRQLRATSEKNKTNYRLLSDSSMAASRALGIAFRVDDETAKKYREYGIDLQKSSGYSHQQLPVPAVFLVGRDGTIHFSYVNPNYKVRLAPEVLMAAARAYRSDAIKAPK
jgi:peroxiredoxin